ncbi:hypothetical protein YPPY11_2049, partial [Yersinia pestis PY-11]
MPTTLHDIRPIHSSGRYFHQNFASGWAGG